jgi:thioester reductase-like protein
MLSLGSLVRDSTVVLRIGQLTGDTENGVWNMTEAWPLMLSTVRELGCLPDLDEPLSWLPVDVAARAILQIANNEDQVPLENVIEDGREVPCPVYHLVNNSISTTWKDLLGWLKSIENLEFDIVEPTEWLNKLEKLESHPGKALLGLWRKAYGGDSGAKDRRLNKSPSKYQSSQLPLEHKGFQFSTEKTTTITGIRSDGHPVGEDLVRKIWAWLDSEMKKG